MEINNTEIVTKVKEITLEIEKNQSDASLFHQRAELYTQLGDYENALDDFFTESELKHDGSYYYADSTELYMTPDHCISLLKKDIHYLDYIYYYEPEYSEQSQSKDEIKEYLSSVYTTQEDWAGIFNETQWAIKYIPAEFLTEDMCREAVKRDDGSNTEWGSLLEYISKEKQTDELCNIAVQHSGWALAYMADVFSVHP
ncbi:hypothetical protein AGMMS49944_29010 [Spirochaetia bacterium]|nr:hypothetical protein AGMMS49944_29010 [Spirochaetia bacterium]